MNNHSLYPLAIHIFLKRDNQVYLLLRANTGYEDGKYSVVAGHVEFGESIIDAGIREAKEEVGVEIKPFNFKIVGTMHRKSNDERIDYFAVVEKWDGEPHNCEPNKCGHSDWYHIDDLPQKTIPYVRFAIQKTFIEKKDIWYEEFGWNTYHELEEKRKNSILEKRGIVNSNRKLSKVYEDIFDSISSIERKFNNVNHSCDWVENFKSMVQSGKILIGTPILRNLNDSSDCVLSACTILVPPMTYQGEIVYGALEQLLEYHLTVGMGVGIDLSIIAEPDKAVKKIDEILLKIDNKLAEEKRRPVAVILTLNSLHPRINEFIECRKDKNFKTTRLNTSIFISNKESVEALKNNISNAIIKCGEPGVLFSDRIEKENDTPHWKYSCTAPCAEIAMADGDACHFSYINLAEFVCFKNERYDFDEEGFIDSTKTVVRFLDDVLEYSIIHCPVDKYKLIREKRRIGVGIAGFATALIKMGIAYNSEKGLEFARKIANLLVYHTKKASIELSQERESFPAYNVSLYKNEDWLKEKFHNIEGSSELVSDILKYRIRNATTLAFPPTGTSSQLAGVSSSFEPYLSFAVNYDGHRYIPKCICDYINNRYSKAKGGELIAQLLRDEVDSKEYPEFVTATDISVDYQLDYTKIFQDVSDGSASKTINVPSYFSVDDIKDCLEKADKLGLKGITIYKEVSSEADNYTAEDLCQMN